MIILADEAVIGVVEATSEKFDKSALMEITRTAEVGDEGHWYVYFIWLGNISKAKEKFSRTVALNKAKAHLKAQVNIDRLAGEVENVYYDQSSNAGYVHLWEQATYYVG